MIFQFCSFNKVIQIECFSFNVVTVGFIFLLLFTFRGYIEAIREIEQQLHMVADSRKFDDIVVACGRSVQTSADIVTRLYFMVNVFLIKRIQMGIESNEQHEFALWNEWGKKGNYWSFLSLVYDGSCLVGLVNLC